MPTRLLVAAALSLAACEGGAPTSTPTPSPSPRAVFPVTLTDDEGVDVTIAAPPRRIVTFAPSNTEILFALDLGSRVVGVSGEFDDHPPEASGIERVGGAGEFGVDPNIEKVVSLEPDLMLTISGGEHWKDRLREAGIEVFTIQGASLDDLLADIETVGRITGATGEAAALVEGMRAEAEAIEAEVAGRPRVTCFFEASPPPALFTVGPDSFIGDLLDRAGCDSVTAEATTDFPEWSVEELVRDDPDVYLVSSEAGVSVEAVAGRPGYDGLSAVREGRVALIDSDLVSRPGPRVVEGLRALADALAPAA